MRDDQFCNAVGYERISARQIDELIGIARGIACDGTITQGEAEFLQKWLAANVNICNQPVCSTLYRRVNEILIDGVLDREEATDLLHTLNCFSDRDFALGEILKSTTLPLCNPPPQPLEFGGMIYCFTGTFNYGSRKLCEQAVDERGGECGPLRKSTDVLVIGLYATQSWKHSSFGNKIIKAAEMRSEGAPISIISEEHWTRHL